MVAIWALAYLGAWFASSAIAYLAARHLGGRTLPVSRILGLSVLAGAIWPLMVLGAIEASWVAMWSAALCRTSEPAETWTALDPEQELSLN